MKKVIFYAPDDRNNTEDHITAICQMTVEEILDLCKENEKGIDVEVFIKP